MSFREKSAWITLVTVLVCFGAYYGAVLSGAVSRGFATVHLLAICVAALVGLQIVLHAVAARLSPREAQAPRDEREALIQARSHTVGYYVLMVMVLLLALPVHFGHPPGDLLNFALLDVVVATLAVSGAQIVMFRRGL
ncbi:MAG: hypothetical protein JF588_16815 [Caulobacterales bacterium]|nr:hypothetical protein [Caulobacterales bacterium]